MVKFKKAVNFKIISLLVAVTFFLQNIGYALALSEKAYLRVYHQMSTEEGRKRFEKTLEDVDKLRYHSEIQQSEDVQISETLLGDLFEVYKEQLDYDAIEKIANSMFPGQLFHAIRCWPEVLIETLENLAIDAFSLDRLRYDDYAFSFHVTETNRPSAGLRKDDSKTDTGDDFTIFNSKRVIGLAFNKKYIEVMGAFDIFTEEEIKQVIKGAHIESYQLCFGSLKENQEFVARAMKFLSNKGINAKIKSDIIFEYFFTLYICWFYKHYRETGEKDYLGIVPLTQDTAYYPRDGVEYSDGIIRKDVGIRGYYIDRADMTIKPIPIKREYIEKIMITVSVDESKIPESIRDKVVSVSQLDLDTWHTLKNEQQKVKRFLSYIKDACEKFHSYGLIWHEFKSLKDENWPKYLIGGKSLLRIGLLPHVLTGVEGEYFASKVPEKVAFWWDMLWLRPHKNDRICSFLDSMMTKAKIGIIVDPKYFSDHVENFTYRYGEPLQKSMLDDKHYYGDEEDIYTQELKVENIFAIVVENDKMKELIINAQEFLVRHKLLDSDYKIPIVDIGFNMIYPYYVTYDRVEQTFSKKGIKIVKFRRDAEIWQKLEQFFSQEYIETEKMGGAKQSSITKGAIFELKDKIFSGARRLLQGL